MEASSQGKDKVAIRKQGKRRTTPSSLREQRTVGRVHGAQQTLAPAQLGPVCSVYYVALWIRHKRAEHVHVFSLRVSNVTEEHTLSQS